MRSELILALAAMAALGAPAAQAQDAAGLFGGGAWTGVYGGVQAELLATKSLEQTSPTLVAPTLLGDQGGGIGGFAGADYQINDMFVIGVAGEANYNSTQLVYNGEAFGDSKWDASIRARAGVLVTPTVLAYGSVGYGWGHYDYSHAAHFSTPGDTFGSTEFTVAGTQFGLGVDAMLTSNIMARLEGTYVHFGENTITKNGAAFWQSTPSIIAIKAGLAFRLN